MVSGYQLYKTRDILRKTEEGTLDAAASKALIRKLAVTAEFHKDTNILVDLRDADSTLDPLDLMQVVLEFDHRRDVFENKIAVLIPDTPDRRAKAEFILKRVELRDLQLMYFVDFEAAVAWLSTVEYLPEESP